MAILVDKKAVFLHVPKTGGSWVTNCLTRQEGISTEHISSKHGDIERVNNFWRHYPYLYARKTAKLGFDLQYKLENSFKFCFVRHPYEWVKSYYRFQEENGWPKWKGLGEEWIKYGNSNWHPNTPLYELSHRSFNDFLRDLIKSRPGYIYELYSWYTGRDIDFVGRQESLEEDLIKVLEKIGCKFDKNKINSLGRVNTTKKVGLKADKEVVREFHRIEYPTLVRFGYKIPSFLQK